MFVSPAVVLETWTQPNIIKTISIPAGASVTYFVISRSVSSSSFMYFPYAVQSSFRSASRALFS